MYKLYRFFFSFLLSMLFITTAISQELSRDISRAHLDQVKRYNTTSQNNPNSTVLQWDDGVNFDAIGLTSGGTFEVSARFDGSITGLYVGQSLTQIEIYINDAPSPCVIKIYDEGTPSLPGSLLYSEDVTSQIVGTSWNLITLSSPVFITGNDIWIGYEVTHSGGFFPAGCDDGPAVPDGDWIYFSGAWDHLNNFGLPYNWNIHGIVESLSGPGPATDPIPASGTTGVSVNISDLMWTNPAGATSLEVYFGDTPGGMSLIYSGALVNSVGVPGTPLNYSTTYYWKVNEIDGSGTTSGSTWNFTTEQNPAIASIFFDDFEAGSGNWTITNDGGNCVWEIIPLGSRPYTMPSTAAGNVFAADADLCGSGTVTNTTAVAGPFDATNATDVTLEFDNDWQAIIAGDFAIVDVSTDGGATWTNILTFDDVDVRNTHEFWPMSVVDGTNFWIRLVSIQPGWDWWWAVDNLLIQGVVIPVELTSFTAKANNNEVVLNWSTATETNNQGFDIERKSNGQFEKVGYVAGFGTTTEVKAYTFTDKTVGSGNFTYRLKQVDFNGTFEYSPEVEIEVSAPKVYQLSQNYPNPFNPATTINFSLASDSKVSLKIFDVIGQEVAQLVNGQLAAGQHNVNFDARSLNSGVYFYKIEANGVDGTSYSSVKKMILTK